VMASGSGDAERVVRGAASRRPLPVEAFRDVVREVLARGAAQ
jgi:hypothetical protein